MTTKLELGVRVMVVTDGLTRRGGEHGTLHSIDGDSVKIVMDDGGDIVSTSIKNVMPHAACIHSGAIAEVMESRADTRRIVQCCICKLVGIKELHALPDRPPFWIYNWATTTPEDVPEPQPSLIKDVAAYRAGYRAGYEAGSHREPEGNDR